MKRFIAVLLSATLLAGSLVPAHAQLRGVLGGSDDDALITIGRGDAGGRGLINLGLGGDDNILDANVGGDDTARVNVGRSGSGGLGVDVDLLDTARVGVDVGGDDLIDIDVGIGGDDDDGGTGGGGGGGGSGGGGGGGVIIGSGGGSNNNGVLCNGLSNGELERLLGSTRIDGSWASASGVNVQPVALCPEQVAWLRTSLPNSPVGQQLRSAIASDALLSASLSRTSYGADRVLAVQKNGSQLVVYVY